MSAGGGVFGRYIRWVIRHRRLVIAATLTLTGLLSLEGLRLRVRTDPEGNFPPDHPYVEIDRRVRKEFGGWNYSVMAVRARHGDIWTPAALQVVYDLTQEARLLPELLPHSLVSLASPNVRVVNEHNGVLGDRYLMRHAPRSAKKVAAIKRKVLSEDMLRRGLISADHTATLVAADFTDAASQQQITEELQALASKYTTPDVEVFFTGGPVLIHEFNTYAFRVWQRFLVAFGVIATLLFLSFGTVQGMVIPVLSGGFATLWAVGIMAALGIDLDQYNTMTPILVMAVTAGHSTQLLKRYYEELEAGVDNLTAVARSVTKIAPVMLTAGLAAAIGFASLAVFKVPSIRVFGVFTALGILCGTAIELSFIPALRCELPVGAHRRSVLDSLFRRLTTALSGAITRGLWWPFAVVFGALLIVSFRGLLRTEADFSLVDYLPAGSETQTNFIAVQRLFPGTLTLVILAEGEGQIATDPKLAAHLAGLEAHLRRWPEVVDATSYVDLLRMVGRALGVTTGDALPQTSGVIDQLLYVSYSAMYGRFLTRDYNTAALWVLLREVPTVQIEDLLAGAQQFVDQYRPKDAHWHIAIAGGVAATRVALTREMTNSKLLNIVIVLSVIGLVSAVFLRSIVAGGLVVLPLVFTVLVDLGLLGTFGMPLDPITASIAAIAVGIGADYGIYLIYRIREELAVSGDEQVALVAAMHGAGRGILTVASAISAGYLTLAFTAMRAISLVGIFVFVTMMLSALVSLSLVPLLIVRFRPRVVFGRG